MVIDPSRFIVENGQLQASRIPNAQRRRKSVKIPIDDVYFKVEVDRSRCLNIDSPIAARLDELERRGITRSIEQLVTTSAIYATGSMGMTGAQAHRAGKRYVWENLKGWKPAAVQHDTEPTKKVLRVDSQANVRVVAHRVEIIAFGVGLETAVEIYDIPFQNWALVPGLARHDLEAYHADDRRVKVEVRGRLNRNNLDKAVTHVHKKFRQGDFSSAAGIIFFPKTTLDTRTSDIMVIDPPGKGTKARSRYRRYRTLLRHYAMFLTIQSGLLSDTGERIAQLANLTDANFSRYLREGDAQLKRHTTRKARTAFEFENRKYVGTAWDDSEWPQWLTGFTVPQAGGAFFWGLWSEVVDAIVNGRLEWLSSVKIEPKTLRSERQLVVLLADGTALLWAATKDELLEHP